MDRKRAFDIVAASTGLIATAPLTLAAAFTMAAINQSSPFFLQKRIGLDGNRFTIIKIKSMREAFDKTGRALPDEQRTPDIGRIMRRLRIDEFPQFINIIRGEMSMVGPRPITPNHPDIAQDTKRQKVKPGLTGLAQIAGKNGLTPTETLALDHEYVDRHSLVGDIWICITTPLSLFKNRNVPHYNKNAQRSRPHEP